VSPTYEYQCNVCDAVTTHSRNVDSRDEPADCNKCLSYDTIRVFSATPVHFKGTGFYSTGG